MAMAPALEFVDATKEYSSFLGQRRLRALDGFTASVHPGEIDFLGRNRFGSG
jgi:hypothetical protein